MKKKNVLASLLLAGAMFLTACGGSASSTSAAGGVSGSFTGTAKGMGEVSVTLTLTDNVITDCTAKGDEETSGIGPGAEVLTTGLPLSVELGPGTLENIYDGIQRPLPEIRALTGETISRGVQVPALNRERRWHFVPAAQPGDRVSGGDVLGTVQEPTSTLHTIIAPPKMRGTAERAAEDGGPGRSNQEIDTEAEAAAFVLVGSGRAH